VVKDLIGNKVSKLVTMWVCTYLPGCVLSILVENETLPVNDPLHRLAALPVKSAGLALTDPVESADANFRASEVTNSHIIQVMRGKEIFSLQDRRATTSKVKAEIKKQKEAAHKSALVAILNPFPRVSRAHLCVVQRLVPGLRFYLRQLLAQSCHRTNYVTASTFDMVVPQQDYNLPVMDVGHPSIPTMLSLVPKADW
jgi:hypothetical protein